MGAASPSYGLALLDLSTAELTATTLHDAAALFAELARADPREALLGDGLSDHRATVALAAPRATLRDNPAIEAGEVDAVLKETFGAELSAAARREHSPEALRAAVRALRFAQNCTKGAPLPVRRIAPLDAGSVLRIDETAQAHLELVRAADGNRAGSLLDVLDATVTAAGGRLLRRRLLAPLVDVAAIRRRLDEVELFVTHARIAARFGGRGARLHATPSLIFQCIRRSSA